MGRRSRNAGISNATLRAAGRTQRQRDEDAHQVASAVYAEAVAWKGQGGAVNMAPVSVSASLAAPGVASQMGLPESAVPEVAAFLVTAFLRLVGESSREEFDAWVGRMRAEGAEAG